MSDTVQNGARRGTNYELVIRGGATDEDYVEGGFRRGAAEDGQLGPIVVTGLEGEEVGGGLSKEEIEAVTEELGEASGMGVVVGGTKSTARPTGYKTITWIQAEEPENAEESDIWIEA